MPIAQAAQHPEAAHPTSDDEKLKIILDGLQSISPYALQILAAAAQNSSQKLESEMPKQVDGKSSKQGSGCEESESLQLRTSRKAVHFDPWTELDIIPGKTQQSAMSARATQQNPDPRPLRKRGKAAHRLQLSQESLLLTSIKAERKLGIYIPYLQEEDAYISNIQKAIV